MSRTKHIFYPAVCFFLFLSGCMVGGGGGAIWQDPELHAVWPERPAPPRVRLLRTIASSQDLRGKNDNRFLSWLIGEAAGESPLIAPYGIAADGHGRVWIADPGAAMVKAYDLADRKVDVLEQAGNMPLISPVAVAYNPVTEKLFVSDSGLGRVFVFRSSGQYEGEIVPEDGFERPAGMAIGPAGNLYVVDVLKGVVEVFDPQIRHLRSIGSAAASSGLFRNPSNVAVDAQNRLYVVDSLRFRIEVQTVQGELVALIGKVGDSPGRFARPRGVAVDSYGHIYVSDAAFDNIQVFDITGRALLYFGTPGKEPGEFCLPAGIDIDRDNRIYVAESCNQRFQVFRYVGPDGS